MRKMIVTNDEDVPEEENWQKSSYEKKKISDTSPLSKFKDKMLEADSNSQRSTTLFQGIENMLALYMLYERIK